MAGGLALVTELARRLKVAQRIDQHVVSLAGTGECLAIRNLLGNVRSSDGAADSLEPATFHTLISKLATATEH